MVRNAGALVRFSRPHTIVATSIQVLVMFILATGLSQGAIPQAVPFLLLAYIASLTLNVYIVGLNQITDVDIDRLNKPYLPLASGDYTLRQGWYIVTACALLTLLIALFQPPYLTLTVGIAFLIGSVYSLPPLRLKEHAVWAALSIAFVRGVVTTLGLYLYFRQALALSTALPALVIVAAVFFFGFGLVIALYKDIPDLEGDRRYTVRTFTVRLGPRRVFAMGRWILSAFYLLPIAYFLTRLSQPVAVFVLVAHLLVLFSFWALSRRIDPAVQGQMARFYLGLWGIFYLEYVLLAVYRLGLSRTA